MNQPVSAQVEPIEYEIGQKPKMPTGIPYIVGNEAAERFSYYGMKTILVVFMTKYLMDGAGGAAPMQAAEAKTWFHTFAMANYFFPIIGALVADIFLGKYLTIMALSVVYCFGHLALALDETRLGLSIGLTLIAIGSGGIKPCVSAHVGDQFTKKNHTLLDKVFSYFYFAINFGGFFSALLTPVLLDKYGPSVAFGVPGVLMFIATVVFWMGRHAFVAVPPVGVKRFKEEVLSKEGVKALMHLTIVYLFIAVFWSLYDQTGSSWVLQAEKLNRTIDLGFYKFELLASQVQALNPILVMAFIPLFTFVVYPALGKFGALTSLRKIGIGFVITALSFALVAWTESQLSSGETMSIGWQALAYIVITAAEVMISVTALEFSYTQAPKSMKSLVMGFYLLSVSLGNGITALVNLLIQTPEGVDRLQGAAYYWFFAGLMAVASLLFVFVARGYKEQRYINEDR